MTFKECRKYGREKLLETKNRRKVQGGRYTHGYMFKGKNGEWYFDFNKVNLSEVRFLLYDNGKVEVVNNGD